jgi:hypothetical protein
VTANTEEETQVDAEGSNVGTSLAADPEDTEVTIIVELDELALVDGSDTELTLDGRNQRGTLEERTGEGFESASELSLAARQLVVEADDGNVLLSSTLLRLDETSGAVNADNQASSDLGIEGTAVASLFASKNALDPGDDLVTGRVRGLVEINDTRADVGLEVALERRAAIGDGGKVTSSNQQFVVVLEEQRPRARVNGRCHGLRLDGVLILLLPLLHDGDFLGHDCVGGS